MSHEWAWEVFDSYVSFDCIWPGRYASALWSDVPKILLLSATLWPYTLQLLGLNKEQVQFRAFDNGWPPNRGLVYYLPVAKLSYTSSDADYARVVAMIDNIIDARRDRKGIIHTVSYSRMRRLLSLSRNSKHMFCNESAGDAMRTAERFRRAPAPAVLLSPSFASGWDFPFEQCEYIIVPKVPFPSAESRVMTERCRDQDYRVYCAALEIAQMIGRGRRAPDDRCETFILDSNLGLILGRGRGFLGKSFSTHRIAALPKIPEKIPEKPLR